MQGPTNEPLRPLPPQGPPPSSGGIQSILRNPLAIIGIVFVVIIILACLCFGLLGSSLTSMFGGTGTNPITLQPTVAVQPGTSGSTSGQINQVVTARQITADRQPTQAVTQFSTNDQTIYAAYHIVSLNAGDKIFARWIYNGNVLTESDTITAPQAYTNRWGEFHISPVQGVTFQPGNYQVQIIINGITAGSANFTVQ